MLYNKILKYCFLFIYVFCIINTAKAEIVDRIVAVVNDDIISLFEVNKMFLPYAQKLKALEYSPEKREAMLFKIREDIINQLINQKITDQETKRTRISVSKQEIDNGIERIKEINYYTDEDLKAALAKEGRTLEEYRKRIKDQILRSKLLNLEVKSKIVITKEDIKSYYEKHPEEYKGEKKYHLKNIVLKNPVFADEDEKLEIKNKIDQILAKIKAGERFEEMAKKYSESSLASEGGDLGTFAYKDLFDQLKSALKGLKQGQITGVLDTEQGYQIFFIQEIIQARKKSLEEASSEIEEKLFNEIVNEKFSSWLNELRQKSHIKIIR